MSNIIETEYTINIQNVNDIYDAKKTLLDYILAYDTIYHHPVNRLNLKDCSPVHYYFNMGNLNYAYYTEALQTLTIFKQPRKDAMLGNIQYLLKPI
jgi:hypothetical protein